MTLKDSIGVSVPHRCRRELHKETCMPTARPMVIDQLKLIGRPTSGLDCGAPLTVPPRTAPPGSDPGPRLRPLPPFAKCLLQHRSPPLDVVKPGAYLTAHMPPGVAPWPGPRRTASDPESRGSGASKPQHCSPRQQAKPNESKELDQAYRAAQIHT